MMILNNWNIDVVTEFFKGISLWYNVCFSNIYSKLAKRYCQKIVSRNLTIIVLHKLFIGKIFKIYIIIVENKLPSIFFFSFYNLNISFMLHMQVIIILRRGESNLNEWKLWKYGFLEQNNVLIWSSCYM